MFGGVALAGEPKDGGALLSDLSDLLEANSAVFDFVELRNLRFY